MSYAEFWRIYLDAHAKPATRRAHYVGSALALAAVVFALIFADWRWLVLAPLLGYGCAWLAHYRIEGNEPQTFGHPVWSLYSDYRMLLLALSGQLKPHIEG